MPRALLSVSDKTGIIDFAKALIELGWEIISTGGTARALREAGLSVKDVSEITGFPEIMDGRVKTLHPKVHGGLLAKRKDPAHMQALIEHDIDPIGLVAVNLYPFKETAERPGILPEDVIEQIDIGGPSMLRSAAKNAMDVWVVVDPKSYELVLDTIRRGEQDVQLRWELRHDVYKHTAKYDDTIADWCMRQINESDEIPEC